MKKKSLLALLVLPLLITGCGSSGDSSVAPEPGKKGDDVLTAEQKQKLFVTEAQNYQLGAKLASVREINVDKLTLETDTNYFRVYKKGDSESNTTEWQIYSKVKGLVSTAFRGQGYTGSTNISASSTFSASFNGGQTVIPLLYYHSEFASASYSKTYNNLVDVFGNTLWSSNKKYSDLRVTSVTGSTEDVYFGFGKAKRYIVEIKATDQNTLAVESKKIVYNEGFGGVVMYDEGGDGINKTQTFRFRHNEIEYTGYSVNGLGYNISYTKEGKNESRFVDTAGLAGTLVGRNYIYQLDYLVEKHSVDYTYASADGLHAVKTYAIDLTTNKTVEIAFPYKINNLSIDKFLPEEMDIVQQYSLPTIAVAELRRVENKHLSPATEKYIVDEDLVLHDDLRLYDTSYQKFGNNYIHNKALYDGEFNYKGDLRGFSVITLYPKCALVKNDATNKYGVMDENGQIVVEAKYDAYNTVDGYIALVNGEEIVYFDPYDLNTIVPVYNGVYQPINSSLFVRVKGEQDKEDPSKYGKDTFYYLGNKLFEVEHFDSFSSTATYTFIQDVETYKYVFASYTDSDGMLVWLSFLASRVRG